MGFTALGLVGCGNGKVISGGPIPTPTPAPIDVSFEYKVPTSGAAPYAITRGPDGYLYFTEHASSKIAQLSTGGTFKEVSTPTAGAAPSGIIAGPNSLIWFAETAAKKIATVTSISSTTPITEYPTGYPNSAPTFLANGPESDTMFFIDAGTNAIGGITTSGSLTAPFAIPSANANPVTFPTGGIVLGPDNNMWFCEYNTAKIGRFNTATVTVDREFPLSAGANPTAIVLGLDGALWFTENNAAAPKLGRLTPSGVLNEYPLTGAKSATGLAVNALGDFDVVDSTANAIGQFDPNSLSYTEYPIKTAASGAQWITIGPDNRMYFTETAANQIGQFSYF
jgi:streptogramin lyase